MHQFTDECEAKHFSCPITSTTSTGGEREIQEVVEERLGIPSSSMGMAAAAAEDGDEIYVAVGNSSSSMEALSWTLRHVANHFSCPAASITASGGEQEIQEVVEELPGIPRSPMSKAAAEGGDEVYVAVGNSNSSMEALSWALRHVATPSSLVYLIHVFPEVHHIPTPLGKLPKNKVTPQQIEAYMDQERNKRRKLLEKFLNHCAAFKVKADTLLIESDIIAKAIVDLIPVLHIERLFIGTTKSKLRKGKLKKGNSKAEQIYSSAPQYCEVKIICQGKEAKATTQRLSDSSLSINSNSIKENAKGRKYRNAMHCTCFSRKSM